MAGEFVEKHMNVEISPEDSGTGLCKTDGWYDDAEAAFNTLPEEVRNAFVSNPAFDDYKERLTAWAAANGKIFGTDGSGNENMLIAKAGSSPKMEMPKGEDSNLPMVIALVSVSILATSGLFMMRKRRNED